MPHHSARRVFQTFVSTVAVVVLLPAVSLGGQSVQAEKNAQHVVIIKQMHFDPAQLTIHSGETAEWKNEDIFSHTVTADDGSFDSELIAPGGSWQMKVKRVGKIGYHCRPHPNMTATLIVQAAAGQQATPSHAAMPGGNQTAATLKWSPPTAPEQFHPILVNFTAALLPLALLSDILGRIFHRQTLHNTAWWMVLYAAVLTPFTAAAGWWWKLSAGSALPAKLISVHQWLGTLAAVFFMCSRHGAGAFINVVLCPAWHILPAR
jgi:plastocyanin